MFYLLLTCTFVHGYIYGHPYYIDHYTKDFIFVNVIKNLCEKRAEKDKGYYPHIVEIVRENFRNIDAQS